MKRIVSLLALVLFLFPQQSEAGGRKAPLIELLYGQVRSTEGEPLEATVAVKKGRQKTRTGPGGTFYLNNVPADAILVVTYKGIKTEISVDGRNKIRLSLVDPYAKMKGEGAEKTVDTGLGEVKKDNYTGSMLEMTAEDIERGRYNCVVDAMRARLGGITVTDEGYVTMRGVNTFNGSIYALILLDGTEVDSVEAADVHDIEKVTVLKDGDMYGSRGANGVVIITTKK